LVRRWRDNYLRHGSAGVSRKLTLYSAAFKQRVLERIKAEGLSHRQAMALFDIRMSGMIGQWQRQYDSGGLDALASARERRARMRKKPTTPKPIGELTREELLEEVLYLRAETAYLKKLDALILEKQAATRGKPQRKPSKG
jgi:transposase